MEERPRQIAELRVYRRTANGEVGSLIAVKELERARPPVLCRRLCGFGDRPAEQAAFGLERCGHKKFLVDRRGR